LKEIKLKTPLREEEILRLQVGDTCYLSGEVYTARDQAHRRFLEYAEEGARLPVDLEGAVIYHSGPLLRRRGKRWEVLSSGPTTSARMNSLTPKMLRRYKVKMLVGKGGMNQEVVEALRQNGAVYCHFTGGAGVLAARSIRKVEGVEWLDLGVPEAVWRLRVENFGPLIVTIDAHGKSLYLEVEEKVEANLEKIRRQILRSES